MFDLDTRSTVVGMSMIIGETKLVSEINEKNEARQTYEQAIADHKPRVCSKRLPMVFSRSTSGILQ
jgi:hypothetical protein